MGQSTSPTWTWGEAECQVVPFIPFSSEKTEYRAATEMCYTTFSVFLFICYGHIILSSLNYLKVTCKIIVLMPGYQRRLAMVSACVCELRGPLFLWLSSRLAHIYTYLLHVIFGQNSEKELYHVFFFLYSKPSLNRYNGISQWHRR